MEATEWILLDTETTGLVAPIYAVELAAQRMRGWQAVGEPFRKLIDHGEDIPPEAARIHGYTREILERDGEPPAEVYSEFAEYVGDRPLVSFNLRYDLNKVLVPEWKRLGIARIGRTGFCALRLAQRLLDPVPAGNCKLQTLRQFYLLPERGAHTALGDVQTVADLLANVLRPVAEQRGLITWEKIAAYASAAWYPTRIPFGKFKGRSFRQAQRNREFRRWLEWLAESEKHGTRRMAQWYLRRLAEGASTVVEPATVPLHTAAELGGGIAQVVAPLSVVIFQHQDINRLREMVTGARERLAEMETAYTSLKAKVDALQAELFRHLRPHYEKRDNLRLVVDYRQAFLEILLREGEGASERVTAEFRHARERSAEDYRQTGAAMDGKKNLSLDEEAELFRLWKKLMKLYHPDRFATEPEKLDASTKLAEAINMARDHGDLETLRQIAENPAEFMLRRGWAALDFAEAREEAELRSLWESLEAEMVDVLEATNELRVSAAHELYQLTQRNPKIFEHTVTRQSEAIEHEMVVLQKRADELARQIEEVSGHLPPGLG